MDREKHTCGIKRPRAGGCYIASMLLNYHFNYTSKLWNERSPKCSKIYNEDELGVFCVMLELDMNYSI